MKDIRKPFINKKYFVYGIWLSFIVLSYYNYHFLFTLPLLIGFSELYTRGWFPFFSRMVCREIVKRESDIFKGEYYYSYHNDLGESVYLYKGKLHNEKKYGREEYYYLGRKINLPAAIANKGSRDAYYKLAVTGVDVDTEIDFLKFFCDNDEINIENYLKEGKVELKPDHFHLIKETNFDNAALLFKYKNFDIDKKELMLLTRAACFHQNLISFKFLLNKILNIKPEEYTEQDIEDYNSLVTILFIRSFPEDAFILLDQFRNIQFSEKEADSLFFYFLERYENDEEKIIKFFGYTNIVKNISKIAISNKRWEDLFQEYVEKGKITLNVNNF